MMADNPRPSSSSGFLLCRFGPEAFLKLYTTSSPLTFESDCRRILVLDLDGLDAAYRSEIDRLISQAPPIERLRLERLRLGPGVDAADWKAFLADYFEAAKRMLAPITTRGSRPSGRHRQSITKASES